MKKFDWAGWLTRLKSPWTMIGLPLVVVALYIFLVADPQYESRSTFFIRSSEMPNLSEANLVDLLSGGQNSNALDNHVLQEFLTSAEMLTRLDKEFGLIKAWQSPEYDPYYRLSATATFDKAVEYYRSRLKVNIGPAGLIEVKFRDFDPVRCQAIPAALLLAGEQFVNEVSRRIADEQVEFADEQIEQARDDLMAIREEIRGYQNEENVLDPTQDLQMVVQNVAALESELNRQQTELRARQSYLSSDAPQIRSLETQIAAVRAQLATERARLVGGQESLNRDLGTFQRLQLEEEFASQAYLSSYSFLQSAMLDASRKVKSLVAIEHARVPTEPSHPRKLYILVTTALIAALIYFSVKIGETVVREHS